MKALMLLVLASLASPVHADDYEDWARDFIVIRERTESCIDAATSHSEAVSCAGKATRECLGEIGEWPYPEPRNCFPRRSAWESLHQAELMLQLRAADLLDQERFEMDLVTTVGMMRAAVEAELAWSDYALSSCSVEGLVVAELSYAERRMLPLTYCMDRMYAERIFYLRSERNWLHSYRNRLKDQVTPDKP
ncbi:hypothetical protein [Tabrizicola sp.]|uniref:hypothetical protein n=1 Tax=Tabrizicola sp. TaxID=2005166 RepID=UPI001A478C84|nr:hypothetical protein [Tabrizicola sp.]MBL9073504.1 hypothetical protein [Tabrizicola sp.]